MKHCAAVTAQGSGQSDLPTLVRLSDLGSGDEHVAVLLDPGRRGLLRRWDDLFDDGVADLGQRRHVAPMGWPSALIQTLPRLAVCD
jgi:hypothetical protein